MLCADWELEGPLLALWPFRLDVWREQAQPIQAQLTDFLLQVQPHQPVLMGVHPREMHRARRYLPQSIQQFPIQYNDAWPRDFGPLWTRTISGVVAHDFAFSAWHGLYPDFRLDQTFCRQLCARFGWQRKSHQQILEGGAVTTNGAGIIGWNRRSIERQNKRLGPSANRTSHWYRQLENKLAAEHNLWIDYADAADETGGHMDNVAQFLTADLLAVDALARREVTNRLSTIPTPVQLLELPAAPKIQPNAQQYIQVQRRPNVKQRGVAPLLASYVNFVRTATAVFVPQFGIDEDREAVDAIRTAVPQLAVIPVMATEMIAGGGGPHCLTTPLPPLTQY